MQLFPVFNSLSFIYLHVSSFHLPKEFQVGRQTGALLSVKLNATVLNTGQKTLDCHFNTWKSLH